MAKPQNTVGPVKFKTKDPVDPSKQVRDLAELDSGFRATLEAALADAHDAGLDPLVIETYRPQERQGWLYAQGRTRSGNKVTWTKNSVHTQRNAADVVPRRNGKIDWNWKDGFDRWGIVAQKHGLVWGGNAWPGKYDGPHVQAPAA